MLIVRFLGDWIFLDIELISVDFVELEILCFISFLCEEIMKLKLDVVVE